MAANEIWVPTEDRGSQSGAERCGVLGEEWFRAIVSRITLALHPGYWLISWVLARYSGSERSLGEVLT